MCEYHTTPFDLPATTEAERIQKALAIAIFCGRPGTLHTKEWCLDQVVRALTGCPTLTEKGTDYRGTPYAIAKQGTSPEYLALIEQACMGPEGPGTNMTWPTDVKQ